MAVPTLSDYEYQFGADGILLNSSAAGGTTATLPFYDVERVSGLDSPEFRTTTRDHEGVDGGYVDSEYMTMRTVVIEGTIYADPQDAEDICDRLRYNFRPSTEERPFYFKHPNKPPRVVFGKGLGARYNVEQLRRWGSTACQCTLICPTPYIYDAAEIIGFGDLGGRDSGFGFDLGFDFGFGGSNSYDGGVGVFNEGNHDAYPIVTIYGPVQNPGLTESRSGKRVEFNLTLGRDDFLEVDFLRHRVTLNGVTSRRHTLVSGPRSWWTVPPGASTIRMTGSQGSGTGRATALGNSVTNDYVEVTDIDASDIKVGDKIHLYNELGELKEPIVFVVVSVVVLGTGNTQIYFTPGAQELPVAGDYIIAGNATFQVSMRSTYY